MLELKMLAKIKPFLGEERLFMIFYVAASNSSSFQWEDSRETYHSSIFPINLLRDLAIESIYTSHYFVSDIDIFPSGLPAGSPLS